MGFHSISYKSRKLLYLPLLLLLFLSSGFGFLRRGSALGINYGQVANNLPPPEQALALISSLEISKTRIYDANPRVLSAFAGSGVDLIVTVPNDLVPRFASDPNQALQWLLANVKPYFPATRITGIAVGNEVYASDGDPSLMSGLVPAMVSVHEALVELGLDGVCVSTASSLAVLQSSYPPSVAAFRPELQPMISQLLRFLSFTRCPFWINAYPYFAYKDDPGRVPLEYVLFDPTAAGMVDPYTKLRYDNMLYAQVDAVVFAMARMGYQGIEVRVSETGWPSKGDADELGASPENARAYNRNLLERQQRNEGTPLRPEAKLEVYLFALFNEDMKPGPTSERNYGLYRPDGTMAYNVGLAGEGVGGGEAAAASVSLASSANRGFTGGGRRWWVAAVLISLTCLGALETMILGIH